MENNIIHKIKKGAKVLGTATALALAVSCTNPAANTVDYTHTQQIEKSLNSEDEYMQSEHSFNRTIDFINLHHKIDHGAKLSSTQDIIDYLDQTRDPFMDKLEDMAKTSEAMGKYYKTEAKNALKEAKNDAQDPTVTVFENLETNMKLRTLILRNETDKAKYEAINPTEDIQDPQLKANMEFINNPDNPINQRLIVLDKIKINQIADYTAYWQDEYGHGIKGEDAKQEVLDCFTEMSANLKQANESKDLDCDKGRHAIQATFDILYNRLADAIPARLGSKNKNAILANMSIEDESIDYTSEKINTYGINADKFLRQDNNNHRAAEIEQVR